MEWTKCHNPIKSNRYSVLLLESFNKFIFAKKQTIIDRYLKNSNFHFNSLKHFKINFQSVNVPKKDSLAHYLSYAALVTYVPVLGAV